MPDVNNGLQKCLIRVHGSDSAIVGAGFLIAPDLICTCFHVVKSAVGSAGACKLNTLVKVDFPYLHKHNGSAKQDYIYECALTAWENPDSGERDIALLRLKDAPPEGASPAHLLGWRETEICDVETYGFPISNATHSIYAGMRLGYKLDNNTIQLDMRNGDGARITEGFSGAPVWDPRWKGVRGIILKGVFGRDDTSLPTMLPCEEFSQVLERTQARVTVSDIRYPNTDGFTLVRDLLSESFKLGSKAEANFPFISTPIKEQYDQAIKTLSAAAGSLKETHGDTVHGLFITGAAITGKTRMALEVIRCVLPDWPVLRWQMGLPSHSTPAEKSLTNADFILFLDDLQEYQPETSRSPSDSSISRKPEAATLTRFIDEARNAAHRMIIIATCLRESEESVDRVRSGIIGFENLTHIQMPTFDLADSGAAEIKRKFAEHGGKPEEWDGTIGSLVLGLQRRNRDYLRRLQSKDSDQGTILRAMKLLQLAGIYVHTVERIRAVCRDVFSVAYLGSPTQAWTAAEEGLDGQYITILPATSQGDEALRVFRIRTTSYYSKVIIGHKTAGPEWLQDQFPNLANALEELGDISGLLSLGAKQIVRKRYDDSTEIFRSVLRLAPSSAAAYVNLGVACFHLGDANQALQEFSQALEIDHNHEIALMNKGRALDALGQFDLAIKAFKKAINADRNSADGWFCLGTAQQRSALTLAGGYADEDQIRKAFLDACDSFEEALRLDPSNLETRYRLGQIFHKLKEYDQAVKVFEEAIHTFEQAGIQDARVRNDLGLSYRALRNWDKAIQSFSEAISINGQHRDAWFNLAHTYELRALSESDRAYYQKAALICGSASKHITLDAEFEDLRQRVMMT